MAQSPGIITNELIQVPTQPLAATTLPVFVGGATKGAIGVATLTTSESDLIRRFGLPTANDYGLLAAIEFFKEGGQCFFLRVADSSVTTALSNILGPEGNRATGLVTLTGNPLDGDSVSISDGATSKVFEFDRASPATGLLTFTGQPVDADTFTLDDGVNTPVIFEYDTAAKATGSLIISGGQPTDGDQFLVGDGSVSVTFEFDSNMSVVETPLLRRVVIGATLSDTLTNLFNAVNATPSFNVTALSITAGTTVNLTNDNFGVAGNVAITEPVNVSTFLSDTGMAGGDDLSAAGSNVPIAIGASTAETVSNTIAAIAAQGVNLAISAAQGTGTTINLVNDANGTAGNVAIIESVTNMTASGMAGGTSAGITPGRVAVAIGASATVTAQNLRTAINAQTFNITASGTGASTVLTNDGVGTVGNVAVTEIDAGGNITVSGMAGGTASGAVLGMTVAAASPGSWGNAIRVTVAPTTVAGAPAGNFDLTVEAPIGSGGAIQVVETFANLSTAAGARFAETVVNVGIVNETNPSRYVTVDVLVDQKPVSGLYQIGATVTGSDGISALTAADYIGTASGTAATGMQTLRNAETVSFNALAVPGVTHKDVIAEMLAICSFRADAIAVIDPPFGLSPQEVTDWHNGLSTLVPNPPVAPLDSDFGALYWAWVQNRSEYLKQSVFLPPSGFVLAAYARTDRQVGPWRAPAGHQRGIVNAEAVEYSPFQAERDILLGGNNAVNPIVSFQGGSGFVIYGNETLARTPKPTDAVHVRRMLIFLKTSSIAATRNIQFEPNDPTTWRNVELALQPLIDFLVAARGVKAVNNDGSRPRAKCDAETNPPELQAQKTVNAKIFISHIDAAETLVLDFTLIASGVGSLT